MASGLGKETIMYKKITAAIISAALLISLAACGNSTEKKVNTEAAADGTVLATVEKTGVTTEKTESKTEEKTEDKTEKSEDNDGGSDKTEENTKSDAASELNIYEGGLLEAADFFSDRDLKQTADTSEAESISLKDGQDVSITKAGVYVISGTASEAEIVVDAGDDDKVQIVLDNATITNASKPCIYVKNADKVFVTTSGDNSLSVTGEFEADGDTKTDAVIFSKDDLVINGTGTLTVNSSDNGISGKDDLKITGSTLTITAEDAGIEANDSVRIADGSITISAGNDAVHAENDDDNSTGFVYICGGTLDLTAGDDGIHATTVVQIDGGDITVKGSECIEGTYVQLNDGNISIEASDDGINAANKSNSYTPTIEVNGGYIKVVMGQGDTDGFDSNGYLYIKGGTVDVTAQFPFDYDIEVEHSGGTIIVNGEETEEITNQFGGMGGMGGKGGFGKPGDQDGDFTPPEGFDPNQGFSQPENGDK